MLVTFSAVAIGNNATILSWPNLYFAAKSSHQKINALTVHSRMIARDSLDSHLDKEIIDFVNG